MLQEASIVVGFVVIFTAVLGSYFKLKYTINGTVKEENECRAKVAAHMENRAIHRDPERDEVRMNELISRLGTLDDKIDSLISREVSWHCYAKRELGSND